MPSCLPTFFKCGQSNDVNEDNCMPALTKINSPTCSHTTNSLSKSPDNDSIRTGLEVWSLEDSLSCTQHEELLQLQSEKNCLIEENISLKNHGAELLAMIEFDQNEATHLLDELRTVKNDLGVALARNTKLEHRAYFTPLESIFSLRTRIKEANLSARKKNVSSANVEFTAASLRNELHKCREERDQAKDMLYIEKKCKIRDNRDDTDGSIFTLEIKAAALLHHAKRLSKSREAARLKEKKRVLFVDQDDE